MDNSESRDEKELSNFQREFLKELENTDSQFNIDHENIKKEFFWQYESNPYKIQENQPQWTPYEREDNLYIEYCYYQYLKGIPRIAKIGDHIIDFDRGLQYHKFDSWKQTRIDSTSNYTISFISRKSRFSRREFMNNPQEINLQDILRHKSILINETSIYGEILKEIYIFCLIRQSKLISGKETTFHIFNEFKIYLSFMLQNYDEDFKRLNKKLIEEMDVHADTINRYIKDSLLDMPEDNFSETIVRIYTVEGFLYRFLNKVLREKNALELNQFQSAYYCLLDVFEQFSSNANKRILTYENILKK